jgi:hypothetical protein
MQIITLWLRHVLGFLHSHTPHVLLSRLMTELLALGLGTLSITAAYCSNLQVVAP